MAVLQPTPCIKNLIITKILGTMGADLDSEMPTSPNEYAEKHQNKLTPYEKGRIKTMTTWKDYTGDAGKAVTTWTYSPDRGFMTRKEYDDGKGTDYTYTLGGKLKTRTWARGALTTYSYNNAGGLELTDYSDSTPDISYTYNRRGQRATASDGVGTHTFAYGDAGQILNTTISGAGLLSGLALSMGYDSLLRRDAFSAILGSTGIYSSTYSFDPASRLDTITNGADSFSYSYEANSNLMKDLVFNNGTSDVMTTSKVYDNLNRLVSTQTDTLSGHSYTLNDANQRVRVDESNGDYWLYTYDDLGQIKTAQKYDVTNTLLAGQDYNYNHDDIGNRIDTSVDSVAENYTSNAVNQYETVGADTLTYDDDGNMLSDGDLLYTYNGENRLVQVIKVFDFKLDFVYDYQGRRRVKTKSVWNGTTLVWDLGYEKHYVYDGWNVVAELDVNNDAIKTMTWGLDLSGSMQGAGGVGGLLSQTLSSTGNTHYYLFDGNGNVTEMVGSVSGVVEQSYRYSAFGKVISESGSVENDYKFSTKPVDVESGLLYYGRRYLDVDTGRWVNRDPIGRRGGLNEYGFVGNDGVGSWDINGLRTVKLIYYINSDPKKVYSSGVLGVFKSLVEGMFSGLKKDKVTVVFKMAIPKSGDLGPKSKGGFFGIGSSICSYSINAKADGRYPAIAQLLDIYPLGAAGSGYDFQIFADNVKRQVQKAREKKWALDKNIMIANTMAHESLFHIIAENDGFLGVGAHSQSSKSKKDVDYKKMTIYLLSKSGSISKKLLKQLKKVLEIE